MYHAYVGYHELWGGTVVYLSARWTVGSPLQEEDLVLFTGGKFYSYNASFHPNIKFNAGG